MKINLIKLNNTELNNIKGLVKWMSPDMITDVVEELIEEGITSEDLNA
jgi:hypothetical protein